MFFCLRYLSDGVACLKTSHDYLRMRYEELQTAMNVVGFGSQVSIKELSSLIVSAQT